jgi:2-amino-4-hydroxy-6-hydroxymethyldihydropteridine diphosphokinase
MQDNIILCLGTNQGNRLDNLKEARKTIQERIGGISSTSSVFESEPWGYSDTVQYLNQVVCISSELLPDEILQLCLRIEVDMGRKRTIEGYESRIIDIDILFYSSQCIDKKDLIIPHPRLHLRKFVLLPLTEILPEFIHPMLNKSIRELIKICNDNSQVKKIL